MRRSVFLFVAAIVICACQFDPYTSEYATAKPNISSLVGNWEATQATLKQLSRSPYQNLKPVIDVRNDGTLFLKDIPDTVTSMYGEGSGNSVQLKGQWHLEKHQKKWWGFFVDSPEWTSSGRLMILRNKPPYRLVLRYGDPDFGYGYEFEKTR